MPPRWIVEPVDANVERNRHIMLHCQAQGVPTPSIVWKKATGKLENIFLEIYNSIYFFPLCRQQIRRIRGGAGASLHQATRQRFHVAAARQRGSWGLLPVPGEQWHWHRHRKGHSAESELWVGNPKGPKAGPAICLIAMRNWNAVATGWHNYKERKTEQRIILKCC